MGVVWWVCGVQEFYLEQVWYHQHQLGVGWVWCPWVWGGEWCGGCAVVQEAYVEWVCYHQHQLGVGCGAHGWWCGVVGVVQEAYMELVCYCQHQLGVV